MNMTLGCHMFKLLKSVKTLNWKSIMFSAALYAFSWQTHIVDVLQHIFTKITMENSATFSSSRALLEASS